MPLIPSILSSLVGAGQAIVGAFQNAKARRSQQKIIDEQKAAYEKEKNTAYTDTTEAKAVLNAAKEQMQEQEQRNRSMAAITGQTHESQLAAQNATNRNYSGLVRQIAAGATAYRQRLDNKYSNILAQQQNLDQQRAESGSNMIGSGVNTAMGAVAGLIPSGTANTGATATAAAAAAPSVPAGTALPVPKTPVAQIDQAAIYKRNAPKTPAMRPTIPLKTMPRL